MRARLFAVFALAAAVCGCATAWSAPTAEPYDALVTGAPVGPNAWVYTITNTSSDPNYSVWLLQIEVDDRTNVLGVASPVMWTANLDVPYLVMWMTGSAFVPAGQARSGFRATYDSVPAYQCWTVMFRNETVPGEFPVGFGNVLVPEPGVVLAMLTGMASLIAQLRKRRGRA